MGRRDAASEIAEIVVPHRRVLEDDLEPVGELHRGKVLELILFLAASRPSPCTGRARAGAGD